MCSSDAFFSRSKFSLSLLKYISAVFICTCVIFQGMKIDSCRAQSLLMATTTSVQDSGLLDYLIPFFNKETGISLQWVSVGTGKALAHAKNCDVDIVLVHAPDAEKAFVKDAYAIKRHPVMYNTFIIVGPKDDPAHIAGKSASLALKSIAEKEVLFVSRGDNSGTHQKEQKLWKKAGLVPPQKEKWYYSIGQGMLHTLNMALEKNAYVLSDSGTWTQFKSKNPQTMLTVLVQDDAELFNQYSILELNPQRCPHIKKEPATKFAHWLLSPHTQQRIAKYKILGQQLFFPNAATENIE